MGFIPEEQISELKDRLDIVDIISEYVDLKRAGSSYKGLCPFHNEKTPSFMVSREKNNFHCFGCHEGGDTISFIMKIENLEYIEAVKFLADKLGFILDEKTYSKEKVDQNNKYYEINSLSAKYYFKNLLTNDLPQEYLEKRSLDKKILNKYFLGYAKNDNGLYNFLKEKGYEEEDMIKLGLVGFSNGRYYDRFRDRLIFPILNNKNKVIGFGGRTLNNHKAKYLNSPESDIFIKGKNIYGINVINRSKRNKIILCEGYMDVISLYNYGIDYAVATLGTAITEDQARLVKRYATDIYIAYDGDEAGIKATLRAIDIFKNMEVNLKIMEFPNDQDPDDFIKENGKDKFVELMEKGINPIDFKLEKVYESSSNKVEFIKNIIDFLATINGNVIRDLYTDKAAKFIGVTTNSLRIDVNNEIEKIRKKEEYRNNSNRENRNYSNRNNKKFNYNNKNNYKYLRSDYNGYNDLNEDESKTEDSRLQLEKEIIIYSLIDKNCYLELKEVSDYIKNDTLKENYQKVVDYYEDKKTIEQVLESESFSKFELKEEFNKLKNSNFKHIKATYEIKNRILEDNLRNRLEEIKEELKTNNDPELIKEYTDLLKKLT